MSADIIDGKAFAERLRQRVADAVPAFVESEGRAPGLAVVIVGDDPASHVYVRSKGKAPALRDSSTGCPTRPARKN